jgi:type II secretory pathway pseudopilin PulG
MPTSIAGKQLNNTKQAGFTYVMVLASVVITGIVIGVADVQTSYVLKRDREEELLFRGMAYRDAIRGYYESGATNKSYPRSLEDLLRDPRSPQRRHIRQLYSDPLERETGDWQLIRGLDGGIAGVASTCKDVPLKKANFPQGMENLYKTKSYSEWRFVYIPRQAIKQQMLLTSPSATIGIEH